MVNKMSPNWKLCVPMLRQPLVVVVVVVVVIVVVVVVECTAGCNWVMRDGRMIRECMSKVWGLVLYQSM